MNNQQNRKNVILAVETSGTMGSVGISTDHHTLLLEETFTAGRRHGVDLLPTIKNLLAKADLTPQQTEAIFISAGPGSFTGLRVGITFARAASQVLNCRIVPVSTPHVIVENLRQSDDCPEGTFHAAAVLDAKRNQIYSAGFEFDGTGFVKTLDPQVIYPRQLLETMPRPLVLTGPGIPYHKDQLQGENIIIADEKHWHPQANKVFELGLRLYQQNKHIDYGQLIPTYIRLPEAEERRQAGLLEHLR